MSHHVSPPLFFQDYFTNPERSGVGSSGREQEARRVKNRGFRPLKADGKPEDDRR